MQQDKSVHKKTIAILIPVFNGLSYTKKCLKKLSKDTSEPAIINSSFEIVVIDDGSSDGTKEWIHESHPEVHVIEGDGNLWWSGGINKGVKYAQNSLEADYILWWNNDIFNADDYFRQLSDLVWNVEENQITGSKIYYAEHPDRIWSYGGEFFPDKGDKHMIGIYEKDGPAYGEKKEVDWFPGMGTLFHISVFDKVGLLDEENFPQYHGDSDYTYRCKLAGYKLVIDPVLKIWNHTENTGNEHDNSLKMLFYTLRDIKSDYNLGKDLTFYRKYASTMKAYRVLAIKYGEYIGGFIKWKFLSVFGRERPEKKERYMTD